MAISYEKLQMAARSASDERQAACLADSDGDRGVSGGNRRGASGRVNQLNVILTRDQKRRLRLYCALHGVTVSDLIRNYIDSLDVPMEEDLMR